RRLIAAFGVPQHEWRQRSDLLLAGARGPVDHRLRPVDAELGQDRLVELRRRRAAVGGTRGRAQRAETERVAAALVPEQRAPAAAANEPPILCPAPRDGARACDEQDARLVAERVRQRGLGIRRDRDVACDLLAYELGAYDLAHLGATGARKRAAQRVHRCECVGGGDCSPCEYRQATSVCRRVRRVDVYLPTI